MAARALIIAIEAYEAVRSGNLARRLPGTLQAGLDFREWLIGKWKDEKRPAAETELLFLSEPVQPFGRRATRADILQSLLGLKASGQNATEELFFFFSGHGCLFVAKPDEPADVVISSDFESEALSGHCCFKLDEIVAWLRAHLGPGRHYHFVDACRNKLDSSQLQVGSQLPWDPQTTAEASTFVLQSTVRGATAVVGGPFAATLLAGLKGTGAAKGWDDSVSDAMFVRYDLLRRYVKDKLTNQQRIASRADGPNGDGEHEAILAKVSPIPLSSCTVKVVGASAADHGEISIKRRRSGAPEVRPLSPPDMTLPLEPDPYWISVQLQGAAVDPVGPVQADMYEDRTVVFRKLSAVPSGRGLRPSPPRPPSGEAGEESMAAGEGGEESMAAGEARAEALVDVVVPPGGEFMLRNVRTGEEQIMRASQRVTLLPSSYLATLRGSNGELLKRAEVELAAGQAVSLDLAAEWQTSTPHHSIASRLPQDRHGVDFSESLDGAIGDADLDLWLALLGAGRIIGSQGDYSKISQFPLHNFSDERPGASPVYVLAGFEDPATPLSVAVSDGPAVEWRNATEPSAMPGIWEAYESTPTGQHLLSVRIGEDPPYTVATATLPNRATLVTLTLEEDGRPRITQFVLPLGHLIDQLPVEVVQRIQGRNQLKDVRFLAQASRAFRKRRDLSKAFHSYELMELLYAKWLDPIGCALAAYEFIRRGRAHEIDIAVENLQRYFPELPDTWALARLSGEPNVRRRGVPLFLDGLRAFPEDIDSLPLAAGHLDYTSTWSAWRAAVSTVPEAIAVPEG